MDFKSRFIISTILLVVIVFTSAFVVYGDYNKASIITLSSIGFLIMIDFVIFDEYSIFGKMTKLGTLGSALIGVTLFMIGIVVINDISNEVPLMNLSGSTNIEPMSKETGELLGWSIISTTLFLPLLSLMVSIKNRKVTV